MTRDAGSRAEQDVRIAFTDLMGGEADGVWAAPGRVNLIGEHVDYAGGRCLPFALPHCAWVAARRRDDGMLRIASVQRPDQPWHGTATEAATAPGWAAYAAGVVWAMERERAGTATPGMDLVLDGRVPTGAGLSSSAAVECAVASAWSDLTDARDSRGRPLTATDEGRIALAEACVRAENEVAGAPTGGMDQAASLRCIAGAALALDCGDGGAENVPFDVAAAGVSLLVIDTRSRHTLGDGRYGARREEVDTAGRALGALALGRVAREPDAVVRDLIDAGVGDRVARRARHVLTEVARVDAVLDLLRRSTTDPSALRAVGPHLDASHESLRADHEVSSPELDLAVSAARHAGALGARMTGGGFGGSVIALLDVDLETAVVSAVTEAFSAASLTAPDCFAVEPSAGARRVL